MNSPSIPSNLNDLQSDHARANNANQAQSQSSQSTREVIDHMARLDFNVKPEGGTLVSFHFEYHDYLDEIGCMDPIEAKQHQQKKQNNEE